MQLSNGKDFYSLENIFAQDFDLEVIPPSLSKICRYSGHCKHFYSVAQHSIICAGIVGKVLLPNSGLSVDEIRQYQLAALFHDAHECMTGFGDVISGHKDWKIKAVEHSINEILAPKLGLDVRLFKNSIIKQADMMALRLEHEQLMTYVPEELYEYPTIDYHIPELSNRTVENAFFVLWNTLWTKPSSVS